MAQDQPQDVRGALHSAALKEDFSTYKLNSMLCALDYQHQQQQVEEVELSEDDIEEFLTSDEDGADSMPSGASLSNEASMSSSLDDVEESCKHLDYYLFNLVE